MTVTKIPSPVTALRNRLHTGNDAAPALDPDLMEAAESAVETMRDSFVSWTGEHIAAIREAAKAAQPPGADWPERIRAVQRLAFELSGLGGTFDYPLLSAIAHSLYALVEGRERLEPAVAETVAVHVEALALVHARRIAGDGGEVGGKLLQSLSRAVAKVTRAHPGPVAAEPPAAG